MDKLGKLSRYNNSDTIFTKLLFAFEFSIAPDYILCSKKAENEFLNVAHKVMEEWYGKNPQENPDMPRIVNEKHFNRLKGLMESTNGTLVFGGKSDFNDLWIEPTVVGKKKKKKLLTCEFVWGIAWRYDT